MDLMSLLARLTLEKDDFDKGLEDAQKDANGFTMPTPKLDKVETKEFDDSLKEAEGESNVFKEVVTGVWQGLKDSLVSVGVTGVIMGVANAMKQGISLVVDGGQKIADNSKNLQISTRAYQEYEYVLGKSNLQMKDLSTVMGNITKAQAGDLTEKQTKAFEALGISAEDAKSGMISTEDMLNKVMNSLSSYDQADKGWIIDTLFGKNDNWVGYFGQTAEDISNLKTEANKMGLIISDESIENAVKFNEATEKISNTIDGIKTSFGESVLPVITDAVTGLEKVISYLTSDKRTLSQVMADQDKGYASQVAQIEGEATAAESLLDQLISMGDASTLTAEQFGIWKGTAEELVKIIPDLSKYINTETGEISENTKEMKNNIRQWANLAKQRALQTLKEEKYAEIVKKNEGLIDKQVELNVKESEAAGKKAAAIKLANEFLNDEDEGEYRQQIFGMTEVNEDNFEQALTAFEYMDGELGQAMREYAITTSQISSLEDEINSKQEELSKGMQEYEDWSTAADQVLGTLNSDAEEATETVNGLQHAVDGIPDEKHITVTTTEGGAEHSFAIGSSYIPYDMTANLHRGERVLTATEARQSSNSEIDYTALENRIVAAIQSGMENATVPVYLNGQAITDEVNRNNINAVKAKRFTT